MEIAVAKYILAKRPARGFLRGRTDPCVAAGSGKRWGEKEAGGITWGWTWREGGGCGVRGFLSNGASGFVSYLTFGVGGLVAFLGS